MTAAPALRATVPAADAPLREAFRRRVQGALERMASEAPPAVLAEALAAPTDIGALARVLGDQAASAAVRSLDPLAASLARGAEARAALAEAAGGLLPAPDVARLLGITRQAVDKRRTAGRLLAMRVGGDWRYPAIQFDQGGGVLPGLDAVLAAMAGQGPWATLDFLLAPDDALEGRTPLALLRAGDVSLVHRLLKTAAADSYA